ncbi:hypothetical protein ACRAWD_17815 [Caulobacter segnis]
MAPRTPPRRPPSEADPVAAQPGAARPCRAAASSIGAAAPWIRASSSSPTRPRSCRPMSSLSPAEAVAGSAKGLAAVQGSAGAGRTHRKACRSRGPRRPDPAAPIARRTRTRARR